MTARHIAYTNRAKGELLALSEAMQHRMVAAIDELKSPDVSHKKVKKVKGRKKGEPRSTESVLEIIGHCIRLMRVHG